MTKSTLLVCVNNTDYARTALKFACHKAAKHHHHVAMLHVFDTSEYQPFLAVADRMREEKYDDAKRLLEQLGEEAATWPHAPLTSLIKQGSIGEQIVQAATEFPDIRQLIIGASPESQNSGKLLLYLTGQLGKTLFTPVLVVPGRLTDEQIEELA